MMGRNHILCTCSMVAAMSTIHSSCLQMRSGAVDNFWGLNPQKLSFLNKIDSTLWSFLGFNSGFDSKFAIFVLFVVIGTLFTDCDSKTSILGRIIYIPVEHRTWLHAIWIPLLCAFAGLRFAPAGWFALGWFLHEFMDSFSREGNAYLYPITKYNKYGSAKVKKGIHNFKLYRTNSRSETIFVIFVIAICIVVGVFFLASPYFKIDITGSGYGAWE